ncbi:unnamed protein product [Musa acuminata subsp. malaccensis]|uniref:(wild Malaysian banana) hypothetical protein n=1 Tax=Musa acuminata subsp. malaccensis TaxID=214687 RepID=A0A804KZ14_MUSAM|nr:unnamed protein product [Musa acuminata subsp. malaccensis]
MMWISALYFDILGALNAVTNLPASSGTAACYCLKDCVPLTSTRRGRHRTPHIRWVRSFA